MLLELCFGKEADTLPCKGRQGNCTYSFCPGSTVGTVTRALGKKMLCKVIFPSGTSKFKML